MKKAYLITLMIVAMTLASIALVSNTRYGIADDSIIEAYEEPSTAHVSAKSSDTVVTMVFINPGDAQQTARAAEELALLLEQETGYKIRSLVPGCLGAAVDWLATGQADFGWLPASTYAFASDRDAAEALLAAVRLGQTYYRGQFLVRRDSNIDSLADLAGKNFAFPNDQSTSGFLFPIMQIFETQGVSYDEFFGEVVFTGSHPSVVDAVYNANHEGTPIDGGAMYEDARAGSSISDIYATTKVVTYTDYIPNDNIAVRPGVPADIRQQIVSGLQAIVKEPAWPDIMSRLYGWEDVAPTSDSAYDPVRDLIEFVGLELDKCAKTTNVTAAAGGYLANAGGDGLTTTIQVPAGAVSNTVRLSFTPIDALTHIPDGRLEIGHAFDLTGVVSGTTQTVTSLTAAYTITVPYLPSQLQGTVEAELGLYWWDGTMWVKEPTSHVEIIGNQVTATPNHFSIFAIIGSNRTYLPLIMQP